MAQTVKFNPKTGKALKKGEKVTVNGKTFTEGSSNIYGDTVKTTNANKSTGSESVKAQQRYLNSLGANLKVDGIAGPLTKAAQAKYGSASKGGTAVAGMSKPGQNMTYASSLPTFTYSKPAPTKKTAVGGFLSKIGSSLKDAISTAPKNTLGANAINAIVGDNITKEQEEKALETISNSDSGLPSNKIAQKLSSGGLAGAAKVVQQLADSVGTFGAASADEYIYQPEPEVQDTISYSGLNPDLTGTGNIYSSPETDEPIVSGGTSGSGDKSLTTDSPIIETNNIATGLDAPMGTGGGMLGQWGALMNPTTGVKTDAGSRVWGEDLIKDNFTGQNIIKINQIADLYKGDLNKALADFNTQQGQEYLNTLSKEGITKEDILAKIQPARNGILGPQNWQEFNEALNNLDRESRATVDEYVNSKVSGQTNPQLLSTNVPPELKAFVDSQNNITMLETQYLNQKEKDMWTNNYNDSMVAIEEIRINEELINKRMDAIDEKTQYYAKKYRAEMKAEEAQIEMSRLTAKKNLTEFLAKIGALRTDGNAQLGIETLDQQYQAQKTAIRTKYNLMIDEMEWEANEKIADLNYGLQKDRLTLMRDLNKSERDIRADLLDIEFQTRKSSLEVQGKLNEKLMDIKIKNSKETNELSEKWIRDLFDLSGWNQFNEMDVDYQNTWLENVIKGKNDKNSWVNQLKPGSISKSNVDKSAEEFYGGSINVNNNDPLGVL